MLSKRGVRREGLATFSAFNDRSAGDVHPLVTTEVGELGVSLETEIMKLIDENILHRFR